MRAAGRGKDKTGKVEVKENKYSVLCVYSWYDLAALQGLV